MKCRNSLSKNREKDWLKICCAARKRGGRAGYQIYRSFELLSEEFGEGKMSSSVSADLLFYCQMGPLSSDWIIIMSKLYLDPGISFQENPESRQSFPAFVICRTHDLKWDLNIWIWLSETLVWTLVPLGNFSGLSAYFPSLCFFPIDKLVT